MIPAGRLLRRLGPRATAAAGGLCFGGGMILAGSTGGHVAGLLAGVSLLGGAGVSLAYVATLVACLEEFPHRGGLVTGGVVAGFGLGAVVLSEAAAALLGSGWSVLAIFRSAGLVQAGSVALLAIWALPGRSPQGPARSRSAERSVSFGRLIRSRRYWALAAGLLGGTACGLLVVGSLKVIALSGGLGEAAATLSISAFAIGNGGGRIAWGWLHDRFGRRTIPAAMGVSAAGACGLLAAGDSTTFTLAAAAGVGLGFGANFVLFPARAAAVFGTGQLARTFPTVFLAFAVSGVLSPPVGGLLYEATGSFRSSLILAAAMAAAGGTAFRLLDGGRPDGGR
jgi:OFA family oxalate/formate antiporter-like MFS transporter